MKKILIWGTGKTAAQICENGLNGEIEGFIETNRSKDTFQNRPVYSINEVLPYYDYIIIANNFINEVYEICIEKGIDIEKIIFLKPIKKRVGELNSKILADVLGEKNYTDYCIANGIYKESFFEKDRMEYEQVNSRESFKINENSLWPVLADKYGKAGLISNYFWQDLWAARLIHRSKTKEHFDIGSRIDGFIAHLLAMDIAVSIIDIREFPEEIEGVRFIVDDATSLRQLTDESVGSMSALCSLEHFGLGRYGDRIDPEACFRCFQEIQKKLRHGGNLYISLPIGAERVEFNAHRVFYPSTIIECFSGLLLREFSCTADGKIEYNVGIHKYDTDKHNGNYRYGLFHFQKE